MYSTCLFCHRSLGSNEAVEQFPVGRRLAFDPAKGRLWVVCRRCERWNLSPLDTRWEAIEECERRFRDTRLRASSDNIGLARLHEGLELVRIGEPLRPEFAAWRWGDQFGRRRRRAAAYTVAGVTAGGLIVVGGVAAGISIGGSWWWFGHLFQRWRDERVVARLHDHEDRQIKVQFKHLSTSRLLATPGEGWALELHHADGWASGRSRDTQVLRMEGEESLPVVGKLMARVNRAGGRRDTIQAAVERIDEAGHPAEYMRLAAREAERLRREKLEAGGRRRKAEKAGALRLLPPDARLALEMAAQEEVEHEAMVGELAILEAAWREAEEVAEIADNLLIPRSVEEFIRRERRQLRGTEE
jgi:hypothetical protein